MAKKSVKKSSKKLGKKSITKSKTTAPKRKTKASKTTNKTKSINKAAKKNPIQKSKTSVASVSVGSKSQNWQNLLAPLYDKVLLEKQNQEVVSKAGLYLGEVTDTSYAKAKVLAIGKGLVTKKGHVQPLDVKVGDFVLLNAYAGNNIKIDNLNLIIVKEEEILGIVEK